MTTHDHDNDHHDHDNDNNLPGDEGKLVASAPAAGALTSLVALAAALNAVDTTSLVGSVMPLMLFKREGDGTWVFGPRKTIPEDGSRWGVNPLSFKRGYVCFGDGNKKLGEHLVPVSEPMPDTAKLPDKGFPWDEQWCVNLKCLDGADAGIEVTFKSTTDGGLKAIAGLLDAVRDRLNGGQHDGEVSPVVQLRKDSYPHPQYGRQWIPIFELVGWMPLSGPAPAPASPPAQAAQQPRRRRVG
jgi:hypothetical protein